MHSIQTQKEGKELKAPKTCISFKRQWYFIHIK